MQYLKDLWVGLFDVHTSDPAVVLFRLNPEKDGAPHVRSDYRLVIFWQLILKSMLNWMLSCTCVQLAVFRFIQSSLHLGSCV